MGEGMAGDLKLWSQCEKGLLLGGFLFLEGNTLIITSYAAKAKVVPK